VDVLVHAAGAITLGPVEEAPVADFDRQYATNVRAAYVLTQGLLPRLKTSHGQVVFVNSSAGLTGRRGSSQYAATKHALHALADSLRDEVNDDGVRVLSVFLGRTATPMQMAVHQAENRRFDPDPLIQAEDVGRIVSEVLRLPRSVEVTEMTLRPMEKPRA
jgi:NADP-dependent 3-hydroxy acid dehydrogenase YdfG